jgi:hypothetical protein
MTSATTATRGVKRASRRDPDWWRDLMKAAIGARLVAAVFSDGWAHFNVPELESFFTPWHAALYLAFAAMAGWVGLLAWWGRRPATPVWEWLPYGIAVPRSG